ncbi:MAG: VirB4 family type IV secretion/conjugal transfer ATPase [Burkholderiales bacterium]
MNAPDVRLRDQLRKEVETNKRIPYEGHVTRHTVYTTNQDFMQVIRLEGVSFETVDDDQLNMLHRSLNNLWRSIASPNVALWHHIVRRKEGTYPDGEYPEGFARDFNEKYRERIADKTLMVNEIFLTVVYRPVTNAIGRTLSGLLRKKDKELGQEDVSASCETLEHLMSEILASLARYEPQRLAVYEQNGIMYSEALEFFGFLVNMEWNKVPVLQASAKSYLAVSRPIFGNETIEIRQAVGSKFGAMLGYTGYPYQTTTGFYDALLVAPYPFVLSQSFTFLSKASAKYVVKTSRNRMINAEDDAMSQLVELDDLLDDLESNRIVMGEHHVSLFVHHDSMKKLEKVIADVKSVMGQGGALVAREDLACEAAFWAMLPGNFKYRPRLSPITSRNFAAMTAFHNFPAGRATGHHWGDALTLMTTSADTPLYYSIHASDPTDKTGGSRKDVGHTMLLGPTGSGKTVVEGFLITLLQKYGLTTICFTKDQDLSILIRALGGKYLPLSKGRPTGCNPFQLPDTPENVQFWNELVRKLVPRALTNRNIDEIKEAINWMKEMPVESRRLGRLLDHMDKEDSDGVYQELKQWCYARSNSEQDGLYAWVLDNPTDRIASMMYGTQAGGIIGFDVTDFLEMPTICAPLNMYLFHLVNQLLDGRRIGVFIAEFWKALGDPAFSKFAEDGLLTMRKKNGFVCMDSQSPQHALRQSISTTLIDQTATKILFPNPEAKREDYINGLSLSEREFDLVKNGIEVGSRSFLIKQGKNSVVARLDLKGFNFELDVISGRSDNIKIVDQLIEIHGDDPAVWLPEFKKVRNYS